MTTEDGATKQVGGIFTWAGTALASWVGISFGEERASSCVMTEPERILTKNTFHIMK